MNTLDLQTMRQRHLEDRHIGGDQTDELFINNPDHPLKATKPGNQVKEIDHVEGQDHKPKVNPAEQIPDDINTRER